MRSIVAPSVILLATSASATPITIPLSRLQCTGSYLKGSPDADRARAAFLKSRAVCGPPTVPAMNLAYVQYTTSVGIGSPLTYHNFVVDTGSSNMFCGTGTPYARTSTSIPTGETVNVTYGTGYFRGLEYFERVAPAPNLVITNRSIGDVLSYADFSGVDGIVGVDPVDLTRGTFSPDMNATTPTVMNNLVLQGLKEKQVLDVYFAPALNYSDTNGALTYRGIESSLFKGELTHIPVTATAPATYFWGIDVTSATYSKSTAIPPRSSTPGPHVLLADDFFAVYLNAIPGAQYDQTAGLIEIPVSSVPCMRSLSFSIAGQTFTVGVAGQLIPTDQNTARGGVAGKQCGVIGPLGSKSGEGLGFIIAQKFMERYYAVFDADTNRVGFTETNNTHTTYQG